MTAPISSIVSSHLTYWCCWWNDVAVTGNCCSLCWWRHTAHPQCTACDK